MKDDRFLILFTTFCFVFAFIFGAIGMAIMASAWWFLPAILAIICILNGILGINLLKRYSRESQ